VPGLKGFGDVFKIPELRRRLLITLGILAAYRVGSAIPIPGVNIAAMTQLFQAQRGTIFGFLDMFSGGALSRMSVFALGVMPYINASIIMSLLQTVVPALQKLTKEGESGQRKIIQITRYLTLVIGIIQAFGLTFWVQSVQLPGGGAVVYNAGVGFRMIAVLTMLTGTMIAMWLGEQITDNGIGNGISLIIFTGIICRLPGDIGNTFRMVGAKEMNLFVMLLVGIILVTIVGLVVLVEQAQRKLPVTYARRVVGRRVYGGQNTYLPLKVDQSGVIAVIFAVSLLAFPTTISQFLPKAGWMKAISEGFMPETLVYNLVYAGLIIFFCYFYTALVFNPSDVAENLRKWGGYMPGVRPGQPTAEYIDHVVTRITFGGALFVCAIAILPVYLRKLFNVPFYFGGTALLIVVGVALDTVGQMESQLIMRHYEGFLKKGRFKGRFFNVK